MPFPSFHDVCNKLLLEELTLDDEFTASAMAHYGMSSATQPPLLPTLEGGLRVLLPPPLLLEPLVLLPTTEAVTYPARAVAEAMATLVATAVPHDRPYTTLDQDHLHVVGPDQPTTSNSVDHALLQCSFILGAPAPVVSFASPALGDPHLAHLVPVGWQLGPIVPRRFV